MTERGKIQRGGIVFDEPLDLPDGTEVFLHIEPVKDTVLEKIPFKVILDNVSGSEANLFRLIALEELSIAEAAQALGSSPEKVAHDWNRLRARLRSRARQVIRGVPLSSKEKTSKRDKNRQATNGEYFEKLPFFGMWSDRDEMNDGVKWVRREREKWHQRLTQQR